MLKTPKISGEFPQWVLWAWVRVQMTGFLVTTTCGHKVDGNKLGNKTWLDFIFPDLRDMARLYCRSFRFEIVKWHLMHLFLQDDIGCVANDPWHGLCDVGHIVFDQLCFRVWFFDVRRVVCGWGCASSALMKHDFGRTVYDKIIKIFWHLRVMEQNLLLWFLMRQLKY